MFLGVDGQDVAQKAGRLFDALASLPLLPVLGLWVVLG
ncbi:hypothetical protein DGo_PB0344 (plasmid) [Deinococcus gobiensis I-0]|uniref:Uncharacterized protein n=1 Tax=Deinococcus gobiensis (strain DSM 21396 / JCM 16679 / CGMCC 1.7299 / I-0) TaxID=745776 RepID=H8H266_DEIGI|nr:hypothetical protein DGo_PB0344 [Deinococcus gobiensis I-0]